MQCEREHLTSKHHCEAFALLVVAELEKLLDHIVAEYIGDERLRVLNQFTKHKRALPIVRPLQLLLNEPIFK